jgi:ribosome biogenesis GTPase
VSLTEWGWGDFHSWSPPAESRLKPARVIVVYRDNYVVNDGETETVAEPSGRMLHTAATAADLPTVGDWVLLRCGVIEQVLPRRTVLSRKAAGEGMREQVLAANIDVVFIVSGLDADLNLRRLERYLIVALESGATPVIILNKADLCASPEAAVAEVRQVAPGCEVLLASAQRSEGIAAISRHLSIGTTGVLIGSSGAGKSTIINRLLETAAQRVGKVRLSDQRGRHITTHRHLFHIPGGGMVIDEPGLREIQLWAGEGALSDVFPEVADLASCCRFRDCRHSGEPGCAVTEAIRAGGLTTDRMRSFEKLRRELEKTAEQHDIAARLQQKREHKRMQKEIRAYYKSRWSG